MHSSGDWFCAVWKRVVHGSHQCEPNPWGCRSSRRSRFFRRFWFVAPEKDFPEPGRFILAGVFVLSCFLVDHFQVVVQVLTSSFVGLAFHEVLENGDVAFVFLTSGEEAVKVDLAGLVVSLAVFTLSVDDVDGLFSLGGFGEKPETEVAHHAVDETLTLQGSIRVCLGANPQVWDVEGESVVCHFGNFPRTSEVLLDPGDVISWHISVHPSCASVVEVGGERHFGLVEFVRLFEDFDLGLFGFVWLFEDFEFLFWLVEVPFLIKYKVFQFF